MKLYPFSQIKESFRVLGGLASDGRQSYKKDPDQTSVGSY